MPLVYGYSKSAISSNIAMLIREGRSRAQASAVALKTAREAWREKHPVGALPHYLRRGGYLFVDAGGQVVAKARSSAAAHRTARQARHLGASVNRAVAKTDDDEMKKRILARLFDEEVQLADWRGGPLYVAAEKMSSQALGSLVFYLHQLTKAPTKNIGRDAYVEAPEGDVSVWRINRTLAVLSEILDARREAKAKTRLREEARILRGTTERGERLHPFANYYVSVMDHGQLLGLLRGPFKTHAEAEDAVEAAKRQAIELDSKATFYGFGVTAMARSYKKPGLLDERGL